MTSRERTLLTVVLSLLAVLFVGFVANSTIIQPLSGLNHQITNEEAEHSRLEGEIRSQQNYMRRVAKLSPRLAQWRKMSLPEGDRKAEAFKTHLSNLSVKYRQYLGRLLREREFQNQSVSPGVFDERNAPKFDERSKKPIYSSLSFSLQGETSLNNVARLFEDLARTPLLHQVKSFSIANQRTSRNLAVKMTVEVLLVTGAQKIDARIKENQANKGKGPSFPAAWQPLAADILPTFSGKGKDVLPKVLADPYRRNYLDIAGKNIFTPARGGPGIGATETPVEPLPDVLFAVRLTLIADSDYYGCRVARMHNIGNKDDSALLTAGPLPEKSRYQEEKKELERRRRRAVTPEEQPKEILVEPVRTWVIKDRSKTPLLEVVPVRIDPLRVILQVADLRDTSVAKKLYALSIGGDLKEVMDKAPLDKEAIRKLGLASDPDEVLGKVKLVELRFRKDRRDRNGAFEGIFANPEKGEKPTLSTESLPEELDIPDEWSVRDRFDSELVRLKVVRVEKARLIFTANNKHYAIKAGETLKAALARPLSEAEVKAITSKAP